MQHLQHNNVLTSPFEKTAKRTHLQWPLHLCSAVAFLQPPRRIALTGEACLYLALARQRGGNMPVAEKKGRWGGREGVTLLRRLERMEGLSTDAQILSIATCTAARQPPDQGHG